MTTYYLRQRIAIRVHGGHQVDVRAVDQPPQIGHPLVVAQQVLGQVDEQLPADGLVAVHVGNVLHRRRQQVPLAGVPRDLQGQQVPALQGTAQVVDARLLGIGLLQSGEQVLKLLLADIVRLLQEGLVLLDDIAAADRCESQGH